MKIAQLPGAEISPSAVLGSALEKAIAGELKDVMVIGFDKNDEIVLTYSTMRNGDLVYLRFAVDQLIAERVRTRL